MPESLLANSAMAIEAVRQDVENDWLARFHAGDRRVLETCYREHFDAVRAGVGRYLSGADQETVIQDVFLSLVSSARTREAFRGGSLGGWLHTVARNRAVDYLRRHRRGARAEEAREDQLAAGGPDPATAAEARLLVRRFRATLPDKWVPVFEARFVEQLSQREAADRLGCSRTTLAYQELRVRRLLRRYLVGGARR